jgi:hypothetical protein
LFCKDIFLFYLDALPALSSNVTLKDVTTWREFVSLWFVKVPGKLDRYFYCESQSVNNAFELIKNHLGWPSFSRDALGEEPTASAVNMFKPSDNIMEILARDGVYEVRNTENMPPSQSLMPF